MCGIVGAMVFEESRFQIDEDYLTKMRDTMQHRGPDGEGLWISPDRQVGLGHRRLAIIDLSNAAAQPMSNPRRTLWITFNGEIYNHRKIRNELESLGVHDWQTDHSDTEVVLRAFEQWGIDCLQKFRGMFAFAIWNCETDELWLVRDRIGIKPLYYSFHNNRLTFASEIKALLADPHQKREIDERALYHYLTFVVTPAPNTLFEGVEKLPPATWMRIDATGGVRKQKYWDVFDNVQNLRGESESQLSERIIDSLRDSVQYRKESDVPIGVFLSGGIDSSANAVLFSENRSQAVKTFTVAYDTHYESNPSEIPYARQIAKQIGSDHHEIIVSQQDMIEFLPQLIHLQDEPIADPVCVPVYFVSKLAKERGVTVCQVGEGADELYCGYPGWRRFQRFENFAGFPGSALLLKLGMWGLKRTGRQESWMWERFRRASLGQPACWGGGGEAFGEWQKQQLLSLRMQELFQNESSWSVLEPIHNAFHRTAPEKTWLNWMSYLDLNFRLPELLLMRVDKMSMGVSLEARVPFLDHEFVSLAMSIPSRMKLKRGNLKHILKKSVRGMIPDSIIDRKKQGFGVPIHEWMMGELGHTLKQELDNFCSQTDLFDRKKVMQLVENGNPASWYLFNLALWWKHYIAQEEIGSRLPVHKSAA